MEATDSAIDPETMTRLRRLLASPTRRASRMWPAVAAAAFAAISALSLAVAMILAPPTVVQHPLDRGAQLD